MPRMYVSQWILTKGYCCVISVSQLSLTKGHRPGISLSPSSLTKASCCGYEAFGMTFRDGSVQDSKKREPSNPKFLRSTALGSREVDWDPTPSLSRNRSPKSPEGTTTVCWKNVDRQEPSEVPVQEHHKGISCRIIRLLNSP